MTIRKIIEYFEPDYSSGKKNFLLNEIKARDIQAFYDFLSNEKGLSNNTILHYHANLKSAFTFAVSMEYIKSNPIDKVQRPKLGEKYKANFYTADELNILFQKLLNDPIEFPVLVTTFYGLRRSELLGLRWDKIDFKYKSITIDGTFHEYSLNGKRVYEYREMTKNKSSRRTLPLVPVFEEKLLNLKEEQNYRKKNCGKAYNYDYDNFIFVDELGTILKPNYLTQHFKLIIDKHGLKPITFHGLRHSCASVLLKTGLTMKEIQDYLGHSNFNTTADIYVHLEMNAKEGSASAMLKDSGVNYGQEKSIFFGYSDDKKSDINHSELECLVR